MIDFGKFGLYIGGLFFVLGVLLFSGLVFVDGKSIFYSVFLTWPFVVVLPVLCVYAFMKGMTVKLVDRWV